jgi:hypothetical protein
MKQLLLAVDLEDAFPAVSHEAAHIRAIEYCEALSLLLGDVLYETNVDGWFYARFDNVSDAKARAVETIINQTGWGGMWSACANDDAKIWNRMSSVN